MDWITEQNMLIKFAGNTKLGETGLEFKALQIHEKGLKKAEYKSESVSANFSGNTNCKPENDKVELEAAGKDLVAMTTHQRAMSQSYRSAAERSPQ